MRKVSLKGIFIGAAVNILGNMVWGFGVVLFFYYKFYQTQPMSQWMNSLALNQTQVVLTAIVAGSFSILGGYVAARLAKHNELLNGVLSSFFFFLWYLSEIGSGTKLDLFMGIIASPILALIGGYLRLKQKR